MFDVTIIGAGVIGCSIARELSKYKLKICVVEKDEDISTGTSKANSAIIHAGFDAKPNSLKGKLNAKGNAMFDKLSEELDFPFKRIGSLVLCFNEEDIPVLENLKVQGEQNKVPDLKILYKEKIREMEPNISNKVVAALYAPSAGIICPYEMTIALAENANDNGVEFKLGAEVKNVNKSEGEYVIKTNKEDIVSKVVINAAGLHSDEINNMVSNEKIEIIARKGQYCLFDKAVGNMVSKTIFQLPTKMGKGILITPTVDGNILIGPNAEDIEDKTDLSTTGQGLTEVVEKARMSVEEIPMNGVIASFAGLRSHCTKDDFIIGEVEDAPNFINVAGIESPGLSSAPAIAEMIEKIVVTKLSPEKNSEFNPNRKGILKFREMSNEERKEIIKKIPQYGKIVCRCETVTEGEIIASIRRTLGAKTLDGVKRRTRSGMGRCQGGFCSAKIVDILCKELNLEKTEITKFGGKSNLIVGKIKEDIK